MFVRMHAQIRHEIAHLLFAPIGLAYPPGTIDNVILVRTVMRICPLDVELDCWRPSLHDGAVGEQSIDGVCDTDGVVGVVDGGMEENRIKLDAALADGVDSMQKGQCIGDSDAQMAGMAPRQIRRHYLALRNIQHVISELWLSLTSNIDEYTGEVMEVFTASALSAHEFLTGDGDDWVHMILCGVLCIA